MSKKNYIPLENQPSDTISAGITITFDDEKKTSDPLSLSSSDSVTINYQNNNHNNNDDYNNNDDELPITVVVTGASGFVASYIIKELLESPKHKYKVIGTVRRPTSNYEWLHTVVDPKKKIRGELILKQVAPLEKEDAYQDLVTIISDADYVLHVASPYVLNPKNVYNDLLKPAISGTENVLNACKTVCNQQRMKHKAKLMSQSYDVTTSMRHNKKKGKYRKSRKHGYSQHSQENSMNGHGGGGGGGGDSKDSNGNDNNNNDGVKLKRVVITSSMAAITDSPIKRYTETDWNLMSSEIRNAYFYSKTEAEKCAWRWMYKYGNIKNWDQLKLVEFDIKFEGNATPITPCSDKDKVPFDLCVCCPWMIIGRQLNAPTSSSGLNTSNQIFVDLINGKYPVKMNLSWAFVDVVDVAHSHIMMIENVNANGRYVLAAETWTFDQVNNLLSILCKAENISDKLPGINCSCPCCGNCCMPCITIGREEGTKSYLETNVNTYPSFDNTRIRSLGKKEGFQFRPIEFCISDLVKWQIKMGYINV